MRDQLLAQLADLIDDTDQLSEFKRGELRGKIGGKPGLNHYLRTTPAGKLRIDTKNAQVPADLSDGHAALEGLVNLGMRMRSASVSGAPDGVADSAAGSFAARGSRR